MKPNFNLSMKVKLRKFKLNKVGSLCAFFLFAVTVVGIYMKDKETNFKLLKYKSEEKNYFDEDEKWSTVSEIKNEVAEDGAQTNKADTTASKSRFKCKPHLQFAYIKTHKTGSSAVRNVVQPYTAKHNLRVATSGIKNYFGGYPGRVRSEFILKYTSEGLVPFTKDDSYIILSHCRFDGTLLREIMDKNTKYISIVREPWYQFQSSFHFYYTCPRSKKTFLSTGCYVYPYIEIAKGKELSLFEYFNLAYENLNSSIPWFFRSKNYQAFDLGLDPMLDDDEEIEIQVQRLSSQIDLMMITEYMDESLILLKDLLCMDWDDVTSYKGENKTPYTSITLEEYPEVMKKFNKMFKLDVALYRCFNATFWQKVEDYGRERMYNDVMMLRRLREKRKEDNDVKDEELSRSRRNSVADSHHRLYTTVPKAPTRKYELNILKRKIAEQSRGLNPSQIIDLADYMADNYGLCPL